MSTYNNYDKLCHDILKLDSQVRFADICDDTGEIKHGRHRDGVQNLLTSEETTKSDLQALARRGLCNSLSPKIGRGKYAMTKYEKISELPYR